MKLRINDGFGMFFCSILTTRPHCAHLLNRFLFEAPMGATRHEHQTSHSRMHEEDGLLINPMGIELSRELLKEGQSCGGLIS